MADRAPSSRKRAAFTLVEVLAALLMMAIIIPVAI
ncbi:MAG: prepilin-type N-terminal cleavage/methylation domain-containing protein [Opitutaceae bacterium]